MKSVLLSGYYGFGNLGDELILKNIAALFRELGYRVYATSNSPSYSEALHRDIFFLYRYDNQNITEIIKEVDLVALGGGGLFQDHYPLSPSQLYVMPKYIVDTFLSVPLTAKIYKKRVAFLFQGVGPLFSDDSIHYTRFAYSLSDYISVRDRDSKQILERLGFSNVFFSSDPSLLYPVEESKGQSSSIRIGISLRTWIHESFLQRAIGSLTSLIEKAGEECEFIFIPFFKDDIAAFGQLTESLGKRREVKLGSYQTLDEAESLIKSLDMMIGMRLHSVILAIKYSIPFISIPYSSKVYSFTKDCGLESFNADMSSENSMMKLYDYCLSHREELVNHLTDARRISLERLQEEIERMKRDLSPEALKANPTEEFQESYLRTYILEQREEIARMKRLYEEAINQIQHGHAEREHLSNQLNQTIVEREHLSNQLNQTIVEREHLSNQLNQTQSVLNSIYSSDFWKVASFYYKVRDNTPIIKHVFKALKILRREGFKAFLKKLRKKAKYNFSQTPLNTGHEIKNNQEVEWVTPVPESASVSYYNKYDVIFFSIINWDFRFQRPQQIASRFAKKGHRVFYLSVDLKKQPSYTKRKVGENVFEVTLPFQDNITIYNIDLQEGMERLTNSMRALWMDFEIKESVAFVEFPYWYPLVNHLKDEYGTKVVYDCLDEFSGFGNVGTKIEGAEERLLKLSDLCVTTATRLYEKMENRIENLVLIRNGTEFDHFHHLPPNNLLSHIKKPIIGYYGAIAEWFDTEPVEHIVAQRPEWSVVLIGHTFGSDVARLKKYKNVHLFEEVPYSQLPQYLYWFDVCIIPFKINKLTLSTNPVKFYEFMSSGKPVVSSKLPELSPYTEYLYLYEEKEEFLKNIELALKENDEGLVSERVKLAKANDWENRFDQIQDHIQAVFPKVSIIIVTFNNLGFTKRCIESIYEKTAYPNFEVIVVDNGSTDGTRDYLLQQETTHSNMKVILNDENISFARANNMGIRISKGEYVILLNNDTVVTRGWVSGLVKYFSDPSVGMVGPVTNSIGNEAKINVNYKDLSEMDRFAESYTREHRKFSFEIPVLALYCAALSRKAIDKVGLLDEQFLIGMFEDDDYAMRLKSAGFKIICAEDVFIHHYGGATLSRLQPDEYQRIFEENKRRYEQKWGTHWRPHKYRDGVI